MASIKSVLGNITERAASTGWQVAAGGAIAAGVFHDASLTPVIAAALSVVKSVAVWFYVGHKAPVDGAVAGASQTVTELKPIVEAIIGDLNTAAKAQAAVTVLPPVVVAAPAAAPAVPVTDVTPAVVPEVPAPAAPAEHLPPFMHPAQ